MPFFAVAHMYAFSHKDYIDPLTHYAARLRFWYATRDAFGLRDVVEDSKATLHATVNYRTYEPVEGGMHVGLEAMYEESRRLVFGDYNYPVIDVSTEAARIEMWDEEERILSNERSAAWSWKGGKRKTLAYSAKGTRGYGATEEAPRASTSNAQTRASFPGSSPHPAIIDHSSDVAPNFDIKGIQLHWAKTGAAVPKRSGSSQGDRRRGPDTPTRLESRTAKGEPQPEHVPDPNEPPELVDQRDDAVDLVVEDRKAGQLEMEWERRRGEPALEGESGLKKVYRRKYDIDDDEEMEIDEARNPVQKPHELPEKLRVNVKERRNSRGVSSPMNPDASSSLGPSSPWTHDNKLGATQRIVSPGSDTDMVISRETQPPRNAQLDGNKSQRRFDDEDSNPWG
ncbi:hypothetical protein FRC16_010055 [Serendipita sp. 398]|nr:hypothetical protein FRC16_010055 [Serendipita sp. 398]